MIPHPNSDKQRRLGLLAGLALGFVVLPAVSAAENMYQPQTIWPGGLDPRPVLKSIAKTQDMATVTWSAPRGPYQVQTKTNVDEAVWVPGGPTTMANVAQVPMTSENEFIRVATANVNYVGQEPVWNCGICHPDTHSGWEKTRHAKALDTLKAIGMDKNARCLPCHTVGYGLPNGYKDEATTPNLAGVQCESCHGPAGDHIANPKHLSVRPTVTISAEVCGGCHTDFHHPTYDEWLQAGHSKVTEPGMFDSGVGRMYQCGVCHSGAVRNAVVRNYDAGGDGSNVIPPTIHDANTFAQVCSTCHDPHNKFDTVLPVGIPAQPAQLRNPISSVKFMSYITSTNSTGFAQQYDANIQMCGQCHNERGATWTGTGRPPHHSPQYNILIGQAVDPRYDTNTLDGQALAFNMGPSGHGNPLVLAPNGNPKQCTACHNRPEEQANPSPTNPVYTGHKFTLETMACAECHGFIDDPDAEEVAEGGIEFIQAGIHEGIKTTLEALNHWAATKIPGINTPGTTNYVAFIGTNAPSSVIPWEFSTIGQLNAGKKGPGAQGQSRMTKFSPEILKSRFLLYLVEHDASYGVHNPPYARYLLKTARELANKAPAIPAE